MKIVVIQHVLRGDDQEDAVALGNAAADATDFGADVVVLPRVPVLGDDGNGDPVIRIFEAIGEERPEHVAFINPSLAPDGVHLARLPHLGPTALFVGDVAMDYQEILTASGKKPGAAILIPGSENDMQAEAMLELAIGLSTSLAGLIVIAEPSGAEPGEAGHGGSAIIHLGEVMAEAIGDDDLSIDAELADPIPQPEPRELLPAIPTILSARISSHLGEKPDVDYPADLS